MPKRDLERFRDFRLGWISNRSPGLSIDGFELPKNWWEDPDEIGAISSTPGHEVKQAKPAGVGNVSSAFSGESRTGNILRVIQHDTGLFVLKADGTHGTTLKLNLTTGKRLDYTTMAAKSGLEHFFCVGAGTPFKIKLETDPEVTLDDNTASAADGAGTNLQSTGSNFQANNVVDGYTVNNITDGSSAFITGITDENNIVHDVLTGGTDNDWTSGDTFNIVSVSKMGISRPSITNATLALSSGGQNNVKGIVKYWIAELTGTAPSDTVESALSVASAKVNTKDGNRVAITLDHADFYNNTYRFYRTHADGAYPRLIGEGTVGASTPGLTFTDDLLDADLGPAAFAHGDPPPATSISIITYFNRIFVLDESTVYWSDVRQPESFFVDDDGNFQVFGADDGDVGTAVIKDVNGIVVTKHAHFYKAYGRNPQDFSIDEITPSDQKSRAIGCPGIAAYAHLTNGFIFYFDRRIYTYREGRITRRSQLIETDLNTIIGTGTFTGRGAFDVVIGRDSDRDRVWITINDITIFYDEKQKRFSGAMEHGYRAYLMDDFGSAAQFFTLGLKKATGALLGDILIARYDRTLAEDQEVTFLVHAGSGAQIRRFMRFDLAIGHPANTALSGDFVIKVDGETLTAVGKTGVTVAEAVARTRVVFPFLLRGVVGHDLQVTFTASTGENGTNKMTLYGSRLDLQDLNVGIGATLVNNATPLGYA